MLVWAVSGLGVRPSVSLLPPPRRPPAVLPASTATAPLGTRASCARVGVCATHRSLPCNDHLKKREGGPKNVCNYFVYNWKLPALQLGFFAYTQKNPRVHKIFCPQFWGRKWLCQFYGRLEKLRSFCRKTAMPIKFFVLGEVFWFWGGGEVRVWGGGGKFAPKFGSEKVSRYTGVSQLQLRVSRYTVQLSFREVPVKYF